MEHPENSEAYKGLKVNSGVENVPTVNPYLKKRVKRHQYSVAEYVEGILKGNITILSQAVTLVESSLHEHQLLAQEIIEKCLPFAGNSMRIGMSTSCLEQSMTGLSARNSARFIKGPWRGMSGI